MAGRKGHVALHALKRLEALSPRGLSALLQKAALVPRARSRLASSWATQPPKITSPIPSIGRGDGNGVEANNKYSRQGSNL
ncbi:hypothetical protein LBMAG47_08720 [Planctomycetia bacterium]|nr:hypothetical protein LBMAG47_08720 [Planctomycetia bacterium]